MIVYSNFIRFPLRLLLRHAHLQSSARRLDNRWKGFNKTLSNAQLLGSSWDSVGCHVNRIILIAKKLNKVLQQGTAVAWLHFAWYIWLLLFVVVRLLRLATLVRWLTASGYHSSAARATPWCSRHKLYLYKTAASTHFIKRPAKTLNGIANE